MKLFKSLGKLSLWQKFLALWLLWLAMVSIPTAFYWKEIGRQIAVYRFEQQGLQPAQLMLDIIQRTQQHRNLTAAFLQEDVITKNSAIKKERRAKAEELEETIVVLEEYARKIKNSKIEKTLSEITNDWHQISQHVTVRDISIEQNFEMHRLVLRKQLDALQMMLDSYQLSRDSEINGYHLISSSLMVLPSFVEVVAQLNTLGATLIRRGEASFSDRVDLKSLLVQSREKMAELDSGIAKATASNLTKDLQEHYRLSQQQYQLLAVTTQEEILSKASFSISPDQFNSLAALTINHYYEFVRSAISHIDNILKNRVSSKQRILNEFLLLVFALTALVSFISVYVVEKLLRQLGGEPRYAIAVVQAMGRGELDHNIVATNSHSLMANIKIMQGKLKERRQLKR